MLAGLGQEVAGNSKRLAQPYGSLARDDGLGEISGNTFFVKLPPIRVAGWIVPSERSNVAVERHNSFGPAGRGRLRWLAKSVMTRRILVIGVYEARQRKAHGEPVPRGGGRDREVARCGPVALQVIRQITVSALDKIIMNARFFRARPLTPERKPTGNFGELGGSRGETGAMMSANKPRSHLVAASQRVSHTGVDVVGGQTLPPTFGEGLLVFLADFPEVVENSRRLDSLEEAGMRR